MTTSRSRTQLYVLLLVGVLAAGLSAWWALSRSDNSAHATPTTRTILPMRAMTAMQNPALITSVPAVVRRLPSDMRPSGDTVQQLLDNAGSVGLSAYAWRDHATDSICYVSNVGGGGCLSSFAVPFDMSETDYDQLGAGQPGLIWGPISDDVVRVDIKINGAIQHATIKNNVALYEMPADASFSSVQAVTVLLRGGGIYNMRL